MRRTLLWIVFLLLLIAGYSAWPFYELYGLVSAVQRRDEAAVAERIDVPRLRRHFLEQVLHAYRRLAGTQQNIITEQFAAAVVSSIADPMVARMATSPAVADLLRTGWPGAALGPKPEGLGGISFDGQAWRLYANSEYGFDEFRLWVPVTAPKDAQYRVTLTRDGATWKLSGVRLPEAIQDRIARELMKTEKLGVADPARPRGLRSSLDD